MKKYIWIIVSSFLFILLGASGYWNYLQYKTNEEILKRIVSLETQLKQIKEENILLRAKLIQPTPEIPGVVFTFDDGPFRNYSKTGSTNHTEIILDTLKAEGIKAAFFVLGSQFDKKVSGKGETSELYKNWLKKVSREGHTLGIHDYYHTSYWKQTKKQLAKSIDSTIKKVKEITGSEPSNYCRSPGGRISPEVENYLSQRGLKHVYWHIEAEPLNMKTTDQYLAHIKEDIDKGMRGIILMHDRNASTYLPELIKYLKAKSIKIISLEEWESKYGLPLTPYQMQSVTWGK
jgi:peptidoglycan/xylan/chitin deacetylase (PgdA/CDA1 family)